MTRKLIALVLAAWVWTAALAGTGWCKNYVYKLSVSGTNLATGESAKLAGYYVFGDFETVVGAPPEYADANAKLIIIGGVLGKKRFFRQDSGRYRVLQLTSDVNDKPRKVVIFTQVVGGNTSDAGSHVVNTTVLSGVVTDPRYALPLKVTGESLSSSATVQDDVLTGGATIVKYKLSLVRDLTDPIPSDETAAETVERVVTFLMDKGFIEFVP